MISPFELLERLSAVMLQPSLLEQIKDKQRDDSFICKVKDVLEAGKVYEFSISNDEIIQFKKIWCTPDDARLKRAILEEAHFSPY